MRKRRLSKVNKLPIFYFQYKKVEGGRVYLTSFLQDKTPVLGTLLHFVVCIGFSKLLHGVNVTVRS